MSASMRSVSDSTYQEPPSGSIVFVTSVSSAMICCVRSAVFIANSLGIAYASSSPLVCSDWVPPSTADIAWNAVRTTLLTGWALVSVAAAVCVWKRRRIDSAFCAPNSSRIIFA